MTSNRLRELIDPTRRFVLSHGDRHGIRLERRYATDVADLWDACTSPTRLTRWLGELRGVPVEGGSVELVRTPLSIVTIKIHRCDPPRRLVAGWTFPGEEETLLDLRIEPDGDGAALTFEHLAMPAGNSREYGLGWDGFVARLAAHLGGDDGAVPASAEVEALTARLWKADVDASADRWPRLDQRRGLIEAERDVPADAATVWAAVTEPDRIAAWFGAFAGDRSAWTIRFDNGTASGSVSDCTPDRRLVTTWRWDFEPAEVPDSVLTVELAPSGSGTTVRLRHEAVTGPVVGYAAGWFAYLEALARVLDGWSAPAADWQADWVIGRAMLRPV